MDYLGDMEEWRDIDGYEGLYQVSNIGRAKSVERVVMRSNGRPHTVKERILKPAKNSRKYLNVFLWKDGVGESKAIHKLVAQAFIANPNGYTDVHHINGNKTDNRAENLEWIDRGEHHALHNKEIHNKRVVQIDKMSGEIMRNLVSTREIERELGYNHSSISACARGENRYKSPYGFIWRYA